MFDRFNRRIHYLRISVTDRCNLRCTYCMPEEGITLIPHSQILSFEEIAEIARVAVKWDLIRSELQVANRLCVRELWSWYECLRK